MILKVQRFGNEDTARWWIYDNIRKISISELRAVPYEVFRNELQNKFDAFFLDQFNQQYKNNNDVYPDNVTFSGLVLRLSDGSEYSIAFDTIAYLCNDEGKTIEKIVGS